MITRTHVAVTVAALAAGSIGLAAPTIGRAAFDAQNAHKVDGYHANQLTMVKYWTAGDNIDDFDTCDWTTILKRGFVTRAKGTVVVQGLVTGEQDFDFTDQSILDTRLVIDGKRVSQRSELATEAAGGIDRGNSPTLGGRTLDKGKHHVSLQAEECGDGAAYIRYRSITLQFSPFGSAEKPSESEPPVLRGNPNQR